jgi:hypothetical protein
LFGHGFLALPVEFARRRGVYGFPIRVKLNAGFDSESTNAKE